MTESTSMQAALATRPVRVTLYEDRAEITRRASATVGPGLQWLVLDGASMFIDDRSVQARVIGDAAQVVSARVSRRVTLEGELGREQIDQLEHQARQAELAGARAAWTIQRARTTMGRLDGLFDQWVNALAEIPHSNDPDRIAAWRGAYDAIEQRFVEVNQAMTNSLGEQDRAHRELAHVSGRLVEGQRVTPRCQACVEVQVDVAGAGSGEIEVEITYRTPCAQWRPEHLARLVVDEDDGRKGRVELITWATAWQATGEAWDDIELGFSTARPASAASAPLIDDDVLWSRRKTAEERRQIVVVATEQAIAATGVEGGDVSVSELPSVDDGGEPVLLRPSSRVSLVSDGRPHRIEVGQVEIAADIDRIVMPEAAAVAHIKATLQLDADAPLLAGPMRVARGGTMVGRSRMEFVAPKSAFELGFGSDDAIRVRRRVDQKRDRTPVVGTQRVERTVTLYLSNLSGDDKDLLVTERIPVSDIEQVEVEVLDRAGWKLDGQDGFLTQRVALSGNERRELTFRYQVIAKSNVDLPF